MTRTRIDDRARSTVLVHVDFYSPFTTQGSIQHGIQAGRICALNFGGVSRDRQREYQADYENERSQHHDADILL
jgi:hypothetical protein